ncbi:D-alanyl-D-alanine carboxypeptidase/D-alanyl-D-alanine-endopeptidase [Bryobacter aggregatus]|uniref:D-alanyl-D-alanine carboxypeptidase/D-alanyl-D-alanine endopeptidase n=1 Tax=Bryobacter aggregatus TaxID=360054 RepID=UPI0004E1AA3F|nr:D-alanyl-D-alanine carboxypeptidase/D-alanyl-D-alanine-endopeptidase [Bryobacter aggregatus]
MFRIFFILLLEVVLANAQKLPSAVQSILKRNPRVHWGIHAVQLKTGRVLVSMNADQYFVPASNMKLFSTAFALETLGTEHRFTTRVLSATPIDTQGSLAGDLILQGGGDPSLSSRRHPYQQENPFAEDRLLPLRELARQLRERGVRFIRGQIVGDDSMYKLDPIPNGWAADDGVFEYGAPVSALSFNDNIFGLRATSGATQLSPAVEYFSILNELRNVETLPRKVLASRAVGSRVLRLSGNIPPRAKEYSNDFAVDEPALYAATAFREVLLEEGIRVDGEAVVRHLAPATLESIELARRDSPPLPLLLQVVDKVSQNLHAELVLRAATQKRPLANFLQQTGIAEQDTNFEDGSGMSRLSLVTPKAVVQLLRYMSQQKNFELFRSLLPVGAQDGTLRNRFDRSPQAIRIQAKTGSLTHISALAGYADSKRHGPIAFQVIANNSNAPSQEVRAAIDRIALALLQ